MWKLSAILYALLLGGHSVEGGAFTFVAQPGPDGVTNYSWFEIANWFIEDSDGNLLPAGRLPQEDDTAMITGGLNGEGSTVRIQTLVLTENATITNGTFSVEDVQMLDGSVFDGSTLFLLHNMGVGGTNCSFSHVTLTILSLATLVVNPMPPSTAADLTLTRGTFINSMGRLVLTNGSQLVASGLPRSEIDIQSSALFASDGACVVRGSSLSPLILDHNGTIRSTAGVLSFQDGIDWQCSGGSQFFNAAAADARISFDSPFVIDAGTTTDFNGPGTTLITAGGALDGNLQLGGADPWSQSPLAGNLEISSPLSGGGQLLTVSSAGQSSVLTWEDGALSFAGITIDAGGEMIIGGDAGTTRELSGCGITNNGMCALLSGGLALDDGAEFLNSDAGTFEIQNDGIFSANGDSNGIYHNLGTILKSSPGQTRFGTTEPSSGPDLNNDGRVEVQSGQLCLSGGQSGGVFQTEDGASLWFWGGSHALQSGASLAGSGRVLVQEQLAPALVALAGGVIADNLEIGRNGFIDGTDSDSTNRVLIQRLVLRANGVVTNGSYDLGSMRMLDSALLADSTATVSNNVSFSGTNCLLESSALTISSNATAALGPADLANDAHLILKSGSLVEIYGQLIISNNCGLSGEGLPPNTLSIEPGASLESRGGAWLRGSTNGSLSIDNSGVIRAREGALEFKDGLAWHSHAGSGVFDVAQPASLLFTGPFNVEPGVTAIFTGPGTNRVAGGAAIDGTMQLGRIVPGTQSLSPANAELAGAIGGAGNLNVFGSPSDGSAVVWAGGTLSLRSVSIGSGAAFIISGSAPEARALSGCAINNAGFMPWRSPEGFVAGAGAVLNNLPGGTIDIQTDTSLGFNGVTPRLLFNNAGTLLKSGGSGGTTMSSDFNSSGVFGIQAGALSFDGLCQQTSGSTVVDKGATLGAPLLELLGGTLSGAGTIEADIRNSAAVSPGGSPGTLLVGATHEYRQAADGTLVIEIGGTTPGAQIDQLLAGGAAVLDGTIDIRLINGLAPQIGDSFQVLSCASISGAFSSVSGDAPDGGVWLPRYNGTNVFVTLVTGATAAAPVLANGELSFKIETTPGISYLVQAASSLNPQNWRTIQTLQGDGTVKTFSKPADQRQGYYRVLIQ